MSKGPERISPQGGTREEKEQMFKGLCRNINRGFYYVGGTLNHPYDSWRQVAIENRMRGLTGRIVAVGLTEDALSIEGRPRFNRYHETWVAKREIAVGKGYVMKTFEEYISAKSEQ